MQEIIDGVLTLDYELSPAQSNAQQRLGAPQLVQRLIEAATTHADIGGFGTAMLGQRGHSWVLNRLSMEVERYPRTHQRYSIRTFITGLNRRFSERCYELLVEGQHAGYARTVWSAIDIVERKGADLSDFVALNPVMRPDLQPDMAAMPRLTTPAGDEILEQYDYRCRVTDLDFNRHLTTVRYLELMVGLFSLDELDHSRIGRMDVSFMREAREGDNIRVVRSVCNDCALMDCADQKPFALSRIRLDKA